MEIRHAGIDRMLDTVESIANRLSLAMVLAALIVSASIVMSSSPQYNAEGTIPQISIGLFIASGVVGFFLLISILRSGRNE